MRTMPPSRNSSAETRSWPRLSTMPEGIRVLRQDRWEALCSFIISQNNNIKRIRGISWKPSAIPGENRCPAGAVPSPDRRCWRPSPRRISSRCAAGSGPSISCMPPAKLPQAKWIWTMWPPWPTEEAAAELCRIRGVGIKVAHCALLYGFHRIECLPVDAVA